MAHKKNQILQFPAEVMKTLRKLAKETLDEEANKNPLSRKGHDTFMATRKF